MHTTRFWNNLHQVCSKPKYLKAKYTVYIHNDSFPIKSAFLPPFRFRKRNLSDVCLIFTIDGESVLSIYLLIDIFSDWKHRWRNTIYIQEMEIRSYVISLGDKDFIFSAQKIFATHLRNTKKENFKKTWCFSSKMSIKTNYTTILRQQQFHWNR